MNSKKRNKNHQNKPPNPSPPQKQEVSEPTTSLPQVIDDEVVESVVEERVPNIISEVVAEEVKESEETPKKPKRNRGKKKKEEDKHDESGEVRLETPVLDHEVQPDKILPVESNIAPAARKKKNKNKKGQGSEEKQEETEIEKNVQTDLVSIQCPETLFSKIEEPEQELRSAKKKNKKKKNRNDSERSEKSEEVSCTSEFQKLLGDDVQTKNLSKPSTDDSSISEATVKEVEIVPQSNISPVTQVPESLEKHETNKNKKKNKKEKKQPSVQDEPKAAEHIQSYESTVTQNVDIESRDVTDIIEATVKDVERHVKVDEPVPSSSSTADDKNMKHKAKIAKPVEKKKKGKDHEKLPDDKPIGNAAAEIKTEIVETIENESVQAPPTTGRTGSTEDLDDIILVPLTEMIPDWQEEVKIMEKNGPIIGCEDKNETVSMEQSIRNVESKNKKKSPKPVKQTETTASSGIVTAPAESEESFLDVCCKEHVESEHDGQIKLKFEEKTKTPDDKQEHIQIAGKNKQRKSPTLPKRDQKISETEIPTETLCQISKLDEFKQGSAPDNIESVHKKEFIQDLDTGNKKDRKKSPKPFKKHESTIEQSDVCHTEETMLPVATNVDCLDILSPTAQEPSEILSDTIKEFKNNEIERVQIPEGGKREKRKKSPKPILEIEVASSSKVTQSAEQNLEIEDIIIIQAEVVSSEKAQTGNIFTASGDVIAKQDNVKKNEDKNNTDKSKKGKRSPKSKEVGHNTENVATENQVEVQMPVTPNIQDTTLSPIAVELETPKIDPMSSPNEVTPDYIEYPRCSSEHLDGNNNMVIQEISYSDARLDVPSVTPDTPFIQGTNINSPELAASGIQVTRVEFDSKDAEEKTDLKSKVLEVNQDMEELRLSIERSLAELTSLDKSDRDTENRMEGKDKKKSDIDKNNKGKVEVFAVENQIISKKNENASISSEVTPCQEPLCPARKDHKGKGKSKKKGKQDSITQNQPAQSSIISTDSAKPITTQETKKEDTNKSEQKSGDAQEKEKKQASETKGNKDEDLNVKENKEKNNQSEFEPIENFEDAMTSSNSVDDVNKTFEIIANEANPRLTATQNNPEINVIAPQEDEKEGKQEKQNPVSPPKNLLGHPDIPVPSSRTDYKKEKNKPPNYRQAKVKIKDANQVEIETPEKSKQSKESQTELKRTHLNYENSDESICVTNQNDDYVYKYSFRKVFLQCACHVCKKDLKQSRVPCSNCNLIFYCGLKHKDEDYSQHQALCFAVSTIIHLKDQKFIYADARDVTGHNYRLLRMQMIVSCEKVLKRRLAPWEQEALLYPRMCGDPSCREWRQGKLVDCDGCGQISYCSEHPEHLPKAHSRWCKSYNLYRALVKHQQTLGRLEPKLPTRVVELSPLPDNINEVLASMYEEKIDMSDIEYAALTQLATAPLTALFCLQHKVNIANGITKKSTLTLHIVGAELQFEADILNKWEVFLLHLVPDVKELRVVLVGPDLNPSNLPLELLGKIKLCENCQHNKRRVVFGFQDKRTYHEFWASEDFTAPDLVCAFNPSIQRSSTYSSKDTWPSTINCILKLRTPFAITSYTLSELTSDLLRVQECATVGYNVVCAPKNNSFASVRPDRNFISDDEAPLLFKNYCVTVLCGV